VKSISITVALVLVAGVILALYASRSLMRIGAGYAAKTVCSGVFISRRNFADIVTDDVEANGHPLLRLMKYSVDTETREVTTSLAGAPWTRQLAVHRKGLGCTVLPDGNRPVDLTPHDLTRSDTKKTDWIDARAETGLNRQRIDTLVSEASGIPGTRAIVVIHQGQLVGEYYGPKISAETPLIGWSMTKTVAGLLTGIMVDQGYVNRSDSGLFNEWTPDKRMQITLEHLLHMESGLEFSEGGDTSDDASGTTNLMIDYLRRQFGNDADWARFPGQYLFAPLGMTSAVMEPDASGNYVGASYMYATARDWAKIGQLMLQRGSWQSQQIVSPDWITFMTTPSPRSASEYGGHVWLRGQGGDEGFTLPNDTFWLLGYDGQSIAVVPSRELVVVRLGLTPGEESFKPQELVEGLLSTDVLP